MTKLTEQKVSAIRKKYRDLEMKVLANLRDLIESSPVESKFVNARVIKVELHSYKEMAIINDKHTFIDSSGQHHDLFSDCTLDDLIDIISGVINQGTIKS